MDTVNTAEGIISVIKEATETWPKDNIKVSLIVELQLDGYF